MEALLILAGLVLAWLAGIVTLIWLVPALLVAAVTHAVDRPADRA